MAFWPGKYKALGKRTTIFVSRQAPGEICIFADLQLIFLYQGNANLFQQNREYPPAETTRPGQMPGIDCAIFDGRHGPAIALEFSRTGTAMKQMVFLGGDVPEDC